MTKFIAAKKRTLSLPAKLEFFIGNLLQTRRATQIPKRIRATKTFPGLALAKGSSLAENNYRSNNLSSDFGGIAQLVERLVRNEKVRGSNPLTSTNFGAAKFTKPSGDENLFAGGRGAHRLKAKLLSWSQSAALDNPLPPKLQALG